MEALQSCIPKRKKPDQTISIYKNSGFAGKTPRIPGRTANPIYRKSGKNIAGFRENKSALKRSTFDLAFKSAGGCSHLWYPPEKKASQPETPRTNLPYKTCSFYGTVF